MRSKLALRLRAGVAALVLTPFIAGCASTDVVSHWTDPQYKGGPLHKIAIFIAAKDESVRRSAEEEAAHSLTGATKGVASFTLYPDQAQLGKAGEEAIRARLVEEGIDGALVIRLQSIKKDAVYVPPQPYAVAAPAGVPYGSFYGYSGYAYSYGYATPGYTVEQTKYIIEALVYKLPQGNMIWSTTTQTVDPNSRKQLSEEVRSILREGLIRDGIVAN